MFGQDWDEAEATIVARDAKFFGSGATSEYTFVADVRLPTGETFRATVHEPSIATDFWPPSVGDVVSVLVRSKDRKVKFDKDDGRLSIKSHHAAQKLAFEAVQGQEATSAVPPEAPVAHTTEGRLAVLEDLHERGVLSDDEYAEQRRRILDGI